MSDKNGGWKQPEAKIPETELEDSFAGFFSEEEEMNISEKGKKRRKSKNGPDILAVSEETDPGFVITEVVALDTGKEVVQIKEEPEEVLEEPEETAVPEPEKEEEQKEIPEENEEPVSEEGEENEEEETSEEETVVVDLSEEEVSAKNKKPLFAKVKKHISKRRKRKYVAAIGAALIVLALIGAVSVCSVLFNLGARVLDNTSQKEAFEWKIYPLMMFDPATFEDPKQLDEELVLKTALWSTLLENKTKYSYDERGFLLVPASDLDVAAKSLYGDAISLKHKSFAEGYDFLYEYNEETSTYSVPVSGQTAAYTPEVVQIDKDGPIYTLIVGYVSPTTLWSASREGSDEAVPDKYLYYDLEKTGRNAYIIKSVRSIPEDELPEDLEVSDMQFINSTQYIDYDSIQQEQMSQQIENENAEDTENSAETENKTEGSSTETSSGESSEGTSSSEE